MAESTALSIVNIDVQQAIEQAKRLHQVVMAMRSDVLVSGTDYGVIPGTKKPTLLKPGAEKLCWALGLAPHFKTIDEIQDFDKPLFHYRYVCELRHIETGKVVATGIGSCNSMEDKYGFRWVAEHDVPAHFDKSKLSIKKSSIDEFDFAIKKAETTGKYGKPAEYWQKFKDAIEKGLAKKIQKQTTRGMSDAWVIESVTYRVPNDGVFSIVNTIDKMAQKRALIAATLIGANASEFFTQDIEDMPDFSRDLDVIEGEIVEGNKSQPPTTKNNQPQQGGKSKTVDFVDMNARRRKVFEGLSNHFASLNEMMQSPIMNATNWDKRSAEIIADAKLQLEGSSLQATGTDSEIPF